MCQVGVGNGRAGEVEPCDAKPLLGELVAAFDTPLVAVEPQIDPAAAPQGPLGDSLLGRVVMVGGQGRCKLLVENTHHAEAEVMPEPSGADPVHSVPIARSKSRSRVNCLQRGRRSVPERRANVLAPISEHVVEAKRGGLFRAHGMGRAVIPTRPTICIGQARIDDRVPPLGGVGREVHGRGGRQAVAPRTGKAHPCRLRFGSRA